MLFLSEILEDKPIPENTLVYFRERLRDRLHSAILEAFLKRSEEKGLKQKDLATRIHRTSAQITRWFSTASNITLDSISDLMVGLGMDFDDFPYTPIEETLAPKEQKKAKKDSASDLLTELIANMGTGLTSKLDEMNALMKTVKSWSTEPIYSYLPSSLLRFDLSETMQPKSGKIIDLAKYRQEVSGQSQIGEAHAQ
jgi:transcriptional regulator with XRE-family HTH domain